MRSKRIPAEEQYRLIMECRQSGLTDHQWCVEHDIKSGTFFSSIELQEYFATKEWYEPLYEAQYFDENLEQFCNNYEMKNGTFISEFEAKVGKYELDQAGYDIYAGDRQES